MEQTRTSVKTQAKSQPTGSSKEQPRVPVKAPPKSQSKFQPQSKSQPQSKVQTKAQPKVEAKSPPKHQVKSRAVSQAKVQAPSKVQAQAKTSAKPQAQSPSKTQAKAPPKAPAKVQAKAPVVKSPVTKAPVKVKPEAAAKVPSKTQSKVQPKAPAKLQAKPQVKTQATQLAKTKVPVKTVTAAKLKRGSQEREKIKVAPSSGYKGISRIDNPSRNSYGWYVRVRFKGVNYSKFFSDSVHGGTERGLQRAVRYRNKLERDIGKPRTDRTLIVMPTQNESGMIGVKKTMKGNSPVYEVTWSPEANVIQRTTVSIRKYGEEEALRKARAIRQAKERKIYGGSIQPETLTPVAESISVQQSSRRR